MERTANNRKRILLIQPPFERLYHHANSVERNALALGLLAGVIRTQTDWQVMIYNADCGFSEEKLVPPTLRWKTGEGFENFIKNLGDPQYVVWQEIRRTIEDFRPSVVGITSTTQTFVSTCNTADIAKAVDPRITVVVGGPHVSMNQTDVVQVRSIDIGVFGEGEATIVDLIRTLEKGESPAAVHGIIHQEGKEVRVNPSRQYLSDLDRLPLPVDTYPHVLKDYERFPPWAFSDIFAVRACPYDCTFCGSRYIWGRNVRKRSVASVVEEFQKLKAIGVEKIYFVDDNFGVDKEYMRELCRAIHRDCPGMNWWCELHCRLVDPETISLMKQAGCDCIQIGVESGNKEMLRKIRKKITIDMAKSAARIILNNDIRVEAFFMVGFPQETEDTLKDTIHAIRTFPCDTVAYSIFMPYPGTEMFKECKEMGIIPDNFDLTLHNHQSPENYFCPSIPKKLFRAYLDDVEQYIDNKNAKARRGGGLLKFLKRNVSSRGLAKVRDKGLTGTVAALRSRLSSR